MGNYLILMNESTGKMHYAVRCADSFRIITVNKKFTEEAEEKVRQGNVAEADVEALGLKCVLLPFDQLESVAYDTAPNGVVIFRTDKKRYRYYIFDEYSEEHINSFFWGLPRVELPKNVQKVKSDWRAELQKQPMLGYLKYISVAINALSVISGFICGFSTVQTKAFFVTSAALWVMAVVLALALPAYFSVLPNKVRKQMGYTTYTADLSASFLLLPLTMGLSFMESFSVLSYGLLFAITLSATALFIFIMYRCLRDFRAHFGSVVLYLIFSALVFFTVTGYINHYANTDRGLQEYTVTELRVSEGSRGRDSFYCTVKTEQGRRVEVQIDEGFYYSLSEGDAVRAYIGKGALGIEYAYVEGN